MSWVVAERFATGSSDPLRRFRVEVMPADVAGDRDCLDLAATSNTDHRYAVIVGGELPLDAGVGVAVDCLAGSGDRFAAIGSTIDNVRMLSLVVTSGCRM